MEWLNQVPWLDRSTIGWKAQSLWDDYRESTRKNPEAPYPVEALIEKHLGLSLEYDDLDAILGESDVLGATWVNEGRVIIHEGLSEGIEGRIAFTCAHEVGHWVLHKEFLERNNSSVRQSNRKVPVVVCRKQDAKLRGEWQADYFAACLLMPEEEVRVSFEKCFGPDPLVMYNRKSCFSRISRAVMPVLDPCLETAKEIAQQVITAGGFTNCSKEAMRYRLEDLGMLINKTGILKK